MTKCTDSGCRNLEWKCADCGRIASTATVAKNPGYGKWIDREKEFPDCDRILCFGQDDIHIRRLIETKWGNHYVSTDIDDTKNYEWTHWMPLAEAPN